jgi:carbamoylphosphate synthase small subunit
MTYPLIGNYGRLFDDDQSLRPWLRGLVVANATAAVLEDARQLASLLRSHGIPAIAGVDTRALARHLRSNGSLRGIVLAPGELDEAAASAAARAVPRWEDQDFVGQVSPAGTPPASSSRSTSRARSSRMAGRCSGSVSGTRSWRGPVAPRRPACGSAITGRTTRSATSTSGSSR